MKTIEEWVLKLSDRERRIYDNGLTDGIREGMERVALWLEETNLTEGWIARKLADALRAYAKETP